MSQHIFISGATSAIAQAFAQRYANQGAVFYLLARDAGKLDIVKQDLLVRGAENVFIKVVDMLEEHDCNNLISGVVKEMGTIDIALLAQGVMYEQAEAQKNKNLLNQTFQVNTLSVINMAGALADFFEEEKSGALLIISSVAGDRGRQSNYIYGASKAALSVFSDGLRNRLNQSNANVITVKPGFVDTPMTNELDKNGPLWATPEKIAEDMEKAIAKGKGVLYTPWFWRYIMLIIKCIPDFIFKKLSL